MSKVLKIEPVKHERPMLVELQWVHTCFCIDCVNRVHGARVSLISPLAYGNGIASGLYEVEAEEDVSKLINALKAHKHVKDIRLVERHGDRALVYLRSKPESLLIETIGKTGAVPLEPSLTKGGVDSSAIYVQDEKQLRELYSLLKDNFEVKLLRKRVLDPRKAKPTAYLGLQEMLAFKSVAAALSPKQMEVISYAVRKGYFDTPKRISVDEIAASLGISVATASEHLRKAQAKFMPFLADLLQNVR
jgi:predicted DNA binding protein